MTVRTPEQTPEYQHVEQMYTLEQEAWRLWRSLQTLPQRRRNHNTTKAARAYAKATERLNRRTAAYEIAVNMYYYSGQMPHLGACSPRTLDEAMKAVRWQNWTTEQA
jgi:hypothetical protein